MALVATGGGDVEGGREAGSAASLLDAPARDDPIYRAAALRAILAGNNHRRSCERSQL